MRSGQQPDLADAGEFLHQITSSLERLRSGGLGGLLERENQRRSVLAALGQNNCGPQ